MVKINDEVGPEALTSGAEPLVPTDLTELIAIIRDFPSWEFSPTGAAWTATRREGTTMRVIAAFTLGELRAAIEAVRSSCA